MSLRLILMIIGALIVLAILIDGYRHWRRAKKHRETVEKRTQQTAASSEPKFVKKVDHLDDLDFTPKIKIAREQDEDALFIPKISKAETPAPEIISYQQPKSQPEPQIKMEPVQKVQPLKNAAAPVKIPEPMPQKDKFIILHVLAEPDTYFSGEALASKFAAQHLHYGSMNIFHYYENMDGSGDVLFSVANAFEPGTLNLDYPKGFYTQGLTLFIQIPTECDAERAFETMLNTATILAKSFNARLCDHQRQPLTAARVEEYRNEVTACNVI